MPLLDHFGLTARWYDRATRNRQPDELLKHLQIDRPGKLLDAGGGTGWVAAALLPHMRQVVVLDESDRMLRQALNKPGLQVTQSQVEQLPFGSELFDRIVMVDAFHHLQAQTRAAAELWRVLAPGGRLVIQEPDLAHLAVKLVALAEKVLLMRSHIWYPQAVEKLFAGAGARTKVIRSGVSAWIIAEKLAG